MRVVGLWGCGVLALRGCRVEEARLFGIESSFLVAFHHYIITLTA